MTQQQPILIAYDGSDPAKNAIAHAAALFPGRPAVVLYVWHSVAEVAGAGNVALPTEVVEEAVRNLDQAADAAAEELAAQGAELAREHGLDATGTGERADPSVWSTIVALADERDAAAVVIGSRGRSGVASALLGSVSNAVVNHSRRPVVVVHPDA